MTKRVILVVLDSAGIGYLPDADQFGDRGADTIGHIMKQRGLDVPNMARLGLYSIEGTSFQKKIDENVIGSYGRCAERGMAKDTTSGHWEMAGYIRPQPFRTFPNGFSSDIVDAFERKIGRKVLGNCVASGTEIIQRLGDEHAKTGNPILYTSADSVFQIAAHEDIIPLEQLYRFCEEARAMLTGDWAVGRVIARPFIGSSGQYTRTGNRKDYAVAPEQVTMLDQISASGMEVVAIGKIEDIFCKRGITVVDHTKDNETGIAATVKAIQNDTNGLIFTNLVDFDMLYGHRNNVEGYGKALEYFDQKLPEIMQAMKEDDLLMITADHGCDPTFEGTDHTREYIPVLAYSQKGKENGNMGTRSSFVDITATIIDYLELQKWPIGESFLSSVIK